MMENIPKDLYDDGYLHLPDILVDSYRSILESRGLLDEAESSFPEESPVGGESIKETQKHFAHLFCVSALRSQYLVLDPDELFRRASINLLSRIQDGKITLLDIPCGSGASIAGLLCSLYELRKSEYRPTTPLNLQIMAGDISSHALEIYQDLLENLHPKLLSVGMNVTYRTYEWDATDPESTAELMDEWSNFWEEPEEYVLYVANFSGSGSTFVNEIKESLRFILHSHYNHQLRVYWLEPGEKKATKEFFRGIYRKIVDGLKNWVALLKSGDDKDDDYKFDPESARFKWMHPLKSKVINGSFGLLNIYKELEK